MVVHIINLLNLLSHKQIIPELLQENCQPDLIVQTVLKTAGDKKQVQEMQKALKLLQASPTEKPAQLIAEHLLKMGAA